MWHHSAQMCVRAWWRFTCSTLTQICQRTVGDGCVCVCKCLRMSVLVFTSDYVHHYGRFVIQFPGCDLLSVISLDFDLWSWPSRGWSEYHFLWKPCSLFPPSRRCHMVYTHYRGCIWICLPLPTKFYNYGNVFRLPDFIPLFFYWFLHFLFFFFSFFFNKRKEAFVHQWY